MNITFENMFLEIQMQTHILLFDLNTEFLKALFQK